MTAPSTGRAAVVQTRSPSFLALVLVTGISPLATDTYIASLPAVQHTLHTSAGTAQLTVTTFIVGLAAGQLVFGPVSDGVGRRRILVLSSALFALLSLACALAPNAAVLLAARTLQGLAGGCGVAVGRAVVSDRYQGTAAARKYGTLAAVTLLAPVVAPAIGGLILLVGDWRAIFVFLTAVGAVMTLAVLRGVPETLSPAARHAPSAAANLRMRGLLRRPSFRTPVVVQCLATAGFFTYIGGSSFVLQTRLGISESDYTVLFASNAAGMAVASVLFRIGVARLGAAALRRIGLAVSTVSITALAGYALLASPVLLAPTWVLLAGTVAGMGLCIPATTTLAQEAGRDAGGTASALQGGLTFVVGAAATPLTGLTHAQTVGGMADLMACFFLLSAASLVVLGRHRSTMGGSSNCGSEAA